MSKVKRIAILLFAIVLMLSLGGCMAKKQTLSFGSTLSEEDRIYYTGQELDSYVTDADGDLISKIPHVYLVDADGNRSEDVSHSEHIKFTGYNLNKEGNQLVTVKYNDGKLKAKDKYSILVVKNELDKITVSDRIHFDKGAFHLGEKFTTYFEPEPGVGRGVSVVLTYTDPYAPEKICFANDPMLEGIKFDTSGCYLDEQDFFTETGTFTVNVSFNDLTAEYQIRVIE